MANKKLKLLYLARYLQEQTDEQHPKTIQDMIDYLADCGISAERKSLYDDLELLRAVGKEPQLRVFSGGAGFSAAGAEAADRRGAGVAFPDPE